MSPSTVRAHESGASRLVDHNRMPVFLGDPAVTSRKGVYEYLLSGKTKPELLAVRLFDDKTRVYKLKEMEADHVTAWSKGGQSGLANCEMLCVTHNRAKGNK